ncbi:hypothetical protein Rwratislav_21568 [Rhodococcus wratislaviensis IFP 2016]|nr:hypothetical protein Rwratislav_21568 [Rhodococcus wratislaviensis IFP 2016]
MPAIFTPRCRAVLGDRDEKTSTSAFRARRCLEPISLDRHSGSDLDLGVISGSESIAYDGAHHRFAWGAVVGLWTGVDQADDWDGCRTAAEAEVQATGFARAVSGYHGIEVALSIGGSGGYTPRDSGFADEDREQRRLRVDR